MIIKAQCPCCGEVYFVNFEVQISDSEKLLSISQTDTEDESKIIHDVFGSISVKDGVDVGILKTVLNKRFGIALDSVPDVIHSIIVEYGMYQERNKLYFKK